MKIKSFIILLGGVCLMLLSACKSEFERIRASGDPELLYKKANEYYTAGEHQRAQTLYELVLSSFRGRPEAEDIYFKYAYTYYQLEQFILASYYFKNFSQTYTNSPKREEADFMSAYSNYQLSPTFRLDQTYTAKAIDELQLFVNTYPRSNRVSECNKLIDELRAKLEQKVYEEGKLYFDLRNYQSATHVFENLLKDFPETRNAEEVRYLIIRSAFLLAENSVVDKQEERYQETINRAKTFLTRYKASAYTREVTDIQNISSRKSNQAKNVGYQNQSTRSGSQR
jgi:outer membrane protein assembly factor BamD